MKKECRFWKKGQKDQRPSSTNHKSSSTNEGQTTVLATYGDVLFTISIDDACVYTSSSSFEWILEFGASHHVTPCKYSFVSYNLGDYGRVNLRKNRFLEYCWSGRCLDQDEGWTRYIFETGQACTRNVHEFDLYGPTR